MFTESVLEDYLVSINEADGDSLLSRIKQFFVNIWNSIKNFFTNIFSKKKAVVEQIKVDFEKNKEAIAKGYAVVSKSQCKFELVNAYDFAIDTYVKKSYDEKDLEEIIKAIEDAIDADEEDIKNAIESIKQSVKEEEENGNKNEYQVAKVNKVTNFPSPDTLKKVAEQCELYINSSEKDINAINHYLKICESKMNALITQYEKSENANKGLIVELINTFMAFTNKETNNYIKEINYRTQYATELMKQIKAVVDFYVANADKKSISQEKFTIGKSAKNESYSVYSSEYEGIFSEISFI